MEDEESPQMGDDQWVPDEDPAQEAPVFRPLRVDPMAVDLERSRAYQAECRMRAAGPHATMQQAYPLPGVVVPHLRLADPPSAACCHRRLTPAAAAVRWTISWLPYVTSSGRQWWFYEPMSLWCFIDTRDCIYFSLMQVNEPRYAFQLTAAGRNLGAQWARQSVNQSGFDTPVTCPVFMEVSPQAEHQEWLEYWRTQEADVSTWSNMSPQAKASTQEALIRVF